MYPYSDHEKPPARDGAVGGWRKVVRSRPAFFGGQLHGERATTPEQTNSATGASPPQDQPEQNRSPGEAGYKELFP
jgi:hypothetical protein